MQRTTKQVQKELKDLSWEASQGVPEIGQLYAFPKISKDTDEYVPSCEENYDSKGEQKDLFQLMKIA